MKELVRVFKGHKIRVIIDRGVEKFIGRDACECLGLDNVGEALSAIPDTEKSIISSADLRKMGIECGNRGLYCVNEPGLYRLIFKSRKPEAEAFKTWVFEEVLPSIRKTGKYDIRDIRAKSIEARRSITDEWKRQGVSKPSEYGGLTRMSYYCLYHNPDVKKAGMDREQILKLAAFEALEAWKLDKVPEKTLGYHGCELSIAETTALIDRSSPQILEAAV